MTCTDTSKGRKHVAGLLALTLLVGAAACGGEADGSLEEGDLAEGTAGSVPGADLGSEVAEDDELAQVAQGLGGFETIWSVGGPVYTLRHIGPTWAVFSRAEAGCETYSAVLLSAAVELRIPVSGCEKMRSAVTSADAIFVADHATGKLYRQDLTTSFEWKLTQIVSSGIVPTAGMGLNGTHVFWADAGGIKRVPRAGGATSTVKAGSGIQLLAVDGSTVYYRTGTAPVALRKIQAGGTGDTLVQNVFGDIEEFSFDADHLYWANSFSGAPTRKLQRRAKDGTLLETLRQSTENFYRLPVSNGQHLYWLEYVDGKFLACRRHLTSEFELCSPSSLGGVPLGMSTSVAGIHVATTSLSLFPNIPFTEIERSGF